MADFMYACWPGARDGAAAARSVLRTAATRSVSIRPLVARVLLDHRTRQSEESASLRVALGRMTADVFSASGK